MDWITVTAVLVAWPIVGLAVAYAFGRFVGGAEVHESANELAASSVSYLRRTGRAKVQRTRAVSHAKVRREATGGRRLH